MESTTPWQRMAPRRRAALAREIADRNGWICALCGLPIYEQETRRALRLSIDHIVPQSLGGTNELDNLRPAHCGCNSSRGNRVKRPIKRLDNLRAILERREAK